jgi:hypothetical protein
MPLKLKSKKLRGFPLELFAQNCSKRDNKKNCLQKNSTKNFSIANIVADFCYFIFQLRIFRKIIYTSTTINLLIPVSND